MYTVDSRLTYDILEYNDRPDQIPMTTQKEITEPYTHHHITRIVHEEAEIGGNSNLIERVTKRVREETRILVGDLPKAIIIWIKIRCKQATTPSAPFNPFTGIRAEPFDLANVSNREI